MGPVAVTFQATQNASNNPSEQNFESYRMNVLKEFIELKPPAFEGESDSLAAEIWLKMVKKMFVTIGVLKEFWVEFATYLFEGSAEEWWDSKGDAFHIEDLNWEEFETLFRETYVPETLRQDMIAHLGSLVQRNMTIAQYHACFVKLSTYDPLMVVDPVSRCVKFKKGLKSNIRDRLEHFTFTNLDELVVAAKEVESSLEQKYVGRIKKNEMKDQLQARSPQDKVNLKSSKENRNNTCFLCGQEGHKMLSCPSKPSSFLATGGDQSGSKDSAAALSNTISYKCSPEGYRFRTCPLSQSPSTLPDVDALREQQPGSFFGEQSQGQSSAKDSGNVHSQACICHDCGQVGHVRRNCPFTQLPSTFSTVEQVKVPPSFSVGRQLQGPSGSKDSSSVRSQACVCYECGQVGHARRNCPSLPTLSAVEPVGDPSIFSVGGSQSGSKDFSSVRSRACICHECGEVGHIRRNCPSLSTLSAEEPLRDRSSFSVGEQLQGQSGSKDSSSARSPACICHECGEVGHIRRNCPSLSTLCAMEPLRDQSSLSVGGQFQVQSGAKGSGSVHFQACICHECGQVGHVRRNCPSLSTVSAMELFRDPSSFSIGGHLQSQSGAKGSGGVNSQACICHECGQVGHVRRNCPHNESKPTLSASEPLRKKASSASGKGKKASSSASGKGRFMPYSRHAFEQIGDEMSRRPAKKLQEHNQHGFGQKSRGQSYSASSRAQSRHTWFQPNGFQ